MTSREGEQRKEWLDFKKKSIEKWKDNDGLFRCTNCGSILETLYRADMDRPLLPTGILIQSVIRFGTCLCYECQSQKQADEYLDREKLMDNGEPEPIVDYSLEPYGWN